METYSYRSAQLATRQRRGMPDHLPAEWLSALLMPLRHTPAPCLILVLVSQDGMPMQIPVFLAYFWRGAVGHSFEAYWMRLHSIVPTPSEG